MAVMEVMVAMVVMVATPKSAWLVLFASLPRNIVAFHNHMAETNGCDPSLHKK